MKTSNSLSVNSIYFLKIILNNIVCVQVLQSTLKWLDSWEQRVLEKLIKPDHFLTNNTAEGLRVTLTSSMQICSYLKEKYDMHYVLTGKINQDALEVKKRNPNIINISIIINYYISYF